jgi:hypothetical protein
MVDHNVRLAIIKQHRLLFFRRNGPFRTNLVDNNERERGAKGKIIAERPRVLLRVKRAAASFIRTAA